MKKDIFEQYEVSCCDTNTSSSDRLCSLLVGLGKTREPRYNAVGWAVISCEVFRPCQIVSYIVPEIVFEIDPKIDLNIVLEIVSDIVPKIVAEIVPLIVLEIILWQWPHTA